MPSASVRCSVAVEFTFCCVFCFPALCLSGPCLSLTILFLLPPLSFQPLLGAFCSKCNLNISHGFLYAPLAQISHITLRDPLKDLSVQCLFLPVLSTLMGICSGGHSLSKRRERLYPGDGRLGDTQGFLTGQTEKIRRKDGGSWVPGM